MWDKAVNLAALLTGIVLLMQFAQEWKQHRDVAIFAFCAAVFIFDCAVVVYFSDRVDAYMKKKTFLTVTFVISLLPMLLNQYGGRKGVQEITGLINLLNPIGLTAAAIFLIGVWVPFQKKTVNTILGALGCTGMVASEVYKFFTWHALTITGEISLQHSIRCAFPEFYVGLCVSFVMAAVYFIITVKVKE